MSKVDILEPIAIASSVLCPVCRFTLETRTLPSGAVVYLHGFLSDYILEELPDYPICVNNAAIFRESPNGGFVRLEPVP
jgi:hypothetical protein